MNLKRLIRKSLPIILSGLSCAGVIGTGVASAKAGAKMASIQFVVPDLPKEDIRKEQIKSYLPAVVVGAFTIGSIIASCILNKKQQAALLAGQLALAQSYGEYRRAVAERYGEEEAVRIDEQIAVEQCKHVTMTGYTAVGNCSLDIPDPQKPMLFQEQAGGIIFESTLSKVIEAEYHLNRNFVLGGEAAVSEFYDFLGLHYDEEDKDIGWIIDDEIYWIDFNHRMGKLSNGETGCIIEFPFAPVKDYYKL